MSRILSTLLLFTCACGGGEDLSVEESLTTKAWVITSYRTGGIERIDAAEGCLQDDVYTFAEDGTASVDLGVLCPNTSAGVYPHVTTGSWALDADGFMSMEFTSATSADCQMTFTGHPEVGRPGITFGFSQPCTNTVAAMDVTAQ